MSDVNLLYKREYCINDQIRIMIPEIGDVIDNESDYYSLVTALTSMPIDLMVQLDDAGIDYTTINDYDLFLILFNSIASQDTSLVFGDLDLSKFELALNKENGMLVVMNPEKGIVIDRAIYNQIATVLRKIHHLEKNRRKPANEEAKEYMLERARQKLKRQKNKAYKSQIEPLIIAMVNTEQYKYNFEETRALTIYQFNESVRQVSKKVDYDNVMYGVYAGTVDPKGLNKDILNWVSG
nr:MAG TPA: hypothetical protein [Caudoviricetes sp.]